MGLLVVVAREGASSATRSVAWETAGTSPEGYRPGERIVAWDRERVLSKGENQCGGWVRPGGRNRRAHAADQDEGAPMAISPEQVEKLRAKLKAAPQVPATRARWV
jgi:hypothetical protein